MRVRKGPFKSRDFAEGFAEGVEHVNDSALAVAYDAGDGGISADGNGWWVELDDEDAQEDDDA